MAVLRVGKSGGLLCCHSWAGLVLPGLLLTHPLILKTPIPSCLPCAIAEDPGKRQPGTCPVEARSLPAEGTEGTAGSLHRHYYWGRGQVGRQDLGCVSPKGEGELTTPRNWVGKAFYKGYFEAGLPGVRKECSRQSRTGKGTEVQEAECG